MKNLKSSLHNLFNRPKHNYKVIDGIRAVAILWVIVFHNWVFQRGTYPTISDKVPENPFLTWISRGDLGVDLFFVISGFLIGTILFKETKRTSTIDFKKFYIRRFYRLIPVYVVAMLMGIYFINGYNIDMAWTNLLYINNYVRDSYMGWTWSLAIEEQFYIVAPFLIAFVLPLFKKKYVFFGVLAIIPIILTYHYSVNIFKFKIPFNFNYGSEDWLDWFWGYYMITHLKYGGILSGIVGAYLNVYYREKIIVFFTTYSKLNNFLIVFSLAIFFLVSNISLGQFSELKSSIFYTLPDNFGTWYEVLHRQFFYYAVCYIIVASIYSSSKLIQPIKFILSRNFWFPIAQISYSGYLFHVMFMFWYFPKAELYFKGSEYSELTILIFNGLVSTLAIILVSTLMYLFIEQPCQRLRNRLTLQNSN